MTSVLKEENDIRDSEIQQLHPLHSSWNFFYYQNVSKDKEWKDGITKVCTVSSIEDFWALFNHVKKIEQIPNDLMFFKQNIPPLWEDESNNGGGRLSVLIKRTDEVTTYWTETLIWLISEQLGELSEFISGVYITSKRGEYRIAVWLKKATKIEILKIAKEFFDVLNLNEKSTIAYDSHAKKGENCTLKISKSDFLKL